MELLIATTMSILVMGATVTLFGVVGDRINGGRAMIETSDRLRAVQNLLRRDLWGHTASMLPWAQPSAGEGYFEIVKGPASTGMTAPYPTANRDSLPGAANVTLGYTQDVLMLTTRSPDQPFTGRYIQPSSGGGGTLTTFESPIAEVVWYLQPTFNAKGQLAIPLTYTLYRRQFLVASPGSSQRMPPNGFYDNFDVSAHPDGNGNMVANSLADLTYRENRFAHNNVSYNYPPPYLVNYPTLTAPPTSATYDALSLTPFPPGTARFGEDVVLTNVLSFDIKVWDPGVEVRQDATSPTTPPLVPSDPGYRTGTSMNPKQYGAYVDLYYNVYDPTDPTRKRANPNPLIPGSYFAAGYYGNGKKSLFAAQSLNARATYDNWSAGYEYYALNAPAATYNYSNNGFDNDGTNGVNDAAERLTCPPYPVPLRGVQIKIRVYEPSTRQVREITVTESFTPD